MTGIIKRIMIVIRKLLSKMSFSSDCIKFHWLELRFGHKQKTKEHHSFIFTYPARKFKNFV